MDHKTMGNVFRRTYFPDGYAGWVTSTGLESNCLTQQSYDKAFSDDCRQYVDYLIKRLAGKIEMYKADPIRFARWEYARDRLDLTNCTTPDDLSYSDLYEYIEKLRDDHMTDAYIEERAPLDTVAQVIGRITYDVLVGYEIAKFWRLCLDQPYEQVQTFFTDNRPNVEALFYEAEEKYKVPQSAAEMIAVYQHYC